MSRVVFLLLPGVHLLDLAGPAQVFSSAAAAGPPHRLAYLAEQPVLTSAQGLPVQAELDWPELAPEDLIIVPGWLAPLRAGTGRLRESTLDRVRSHHARGGTVASVCSGALVLGRAGLLDGRRCTTHHQIQDELARRHPRARVVPDVLYTDDDRVLTSAGIASGIDLALHVLAVRHGPGLAARVAREMVVFARRNGDAPQLSALLRHRSHLDELVHRAQDVIEERFDQSLPLGGLAAETGVSPRTLTRAFTAATGMTPLRYQQALRRERAEHLIGQGASVETAAHEVGFEDPRMLRRLRAQAPALG